MFGEQHGEEPMRWNQSNETTLLVDHGKGRLAVAHCVPRSQFLVDSWRDRASRSISDPTVDSPDALSRSSRVTMPRNRPARHTTR
jgi:hypothetical protein